MSPRNAQITTPAVSRITVTRPDPMRSLIITAVSRHISVPPAAPSNVLLGLVFLALFRFPKVARNLFEAVEDRQDDKCKGPILCHVK